MCADAVVDWLFGVLCFFLQTLGGNQLTGHDQQQKECEGDETRRELKRGLTIFNRNFFLLLLLHNVSSVSNSAGSGVCMCCLSWDQQR